MGYGFNSNGATGGYTPHLTAGQKAAATRRANRAAGIPPKSKGSKRTRTRGGPAFTTPKPDARGLTLVALAALEDVFVVKLQKTGITPDARKAYDRYTKLKALALGHCTDQSTQNEADSALRMSLIEAVKLAF